MKFLKACMRVTTLFKFSLVGIAASTIHVAVFLLFHYQLEFSWLGANTVAFLSAFIASFLAHFFWTYELKQGIKDALMKFSVVAVLVFFISSFTLWIFIDLVKLHAAGSIVINAIISAMLSFILSSVWVFKQSGK
jgi:putative flippase GtrA